MHLNLKGANNELENFKYKNQNLHPSKCIRTRYEILIRHADSFFPLNLLTRKGHPFL